MFRFFNLISINESTLDIRIGYLNNLCRRRVREIWPSVGQQVENDPLQRRSAPRRPLQGRSSDIIASLSPQLVHVTTDI